MRTRSGFGLTLGLGAILLSGACSDPRGGSALLEIYAASSLTEAFRELEALFEADHPDTDVVLTFAGSQVLRLQIEQGAAPALYASADPRHMAALVEQGLVRHSEVFAHNELTVIVPASDPGAIRSFADLPDVRRLVIGTPNVPAGRYAREVLRRSEAQLGRDFGQRVLARVVSEEANVRLTRAKVELGEADAAFVYVTDVIGPDIRSVPIPEGLNVRAEYLIGCLESSADPRLAGRWIGLLRSPAGQSVLLRHGFIVP